MTILEPILVDLIPFALLKLVIESGYYILIFEILIKQRENKKAENKREPKPSKAPPKGESKRNKGEAKRNKNYLLENCGLLLAFLLPYFLRSTTLESLVSKPLGFKTALKAIS